AVRLQLIPFHGGEYGGRLFAAHHGDLGVGPHPQEAWAVRPATHRVVARSVGAADDDRELGNAGTGDGGDHLGAVLRDTSGLVVAPDHEARDVLEEQQRNAALIAEFDEVGALLG